MDTKMHAGSDSQYNRFRLTRRIVAVGLFCLGVSSCSWLSNTLGRAFEKPTLEYDSVDVEDISLRGITLQLVFKIHNPNGVDLSLADVDYTLKVEDVQVASMRPQAGLRLPAKSTVLLPFRARMEYTNVATVAEALIKKGFAQFRAEGVVGVQTPIGLLQLPIEKTGSFELPGRPKKQE